MSICADADEIFMATILEVCGDSKSVKILFA